jgi:hypothetical protein
MDRAFARNIVRSASRNFLLTALLSIKPSYPDSTFWISFIKLILYQRFSFLSFPNLSFTTKFHPLLDRRAIKRFLKRIISATPNPTLVNTKLSNETRVSFSSHPSIKSILCNHRTFAKSINLPIAAARHYHKTPLNMSSPMAPFLMRRLFSSYQ